MISHLKGSVLFSGNGFVILEVAGVGYKVFISSDIMQKLKKGTSGEVSLWVHQAVRENSLDLYGFLEYAELEFFELLITISGIGPKSALGILSVAPLDTLRQAISSGDTSYLTKVSGIGRKNAEKIVVELRDKLGGLDSEFGASTLKEETEVVEALQALGYSQREARDALKNIDDSAETASDKIKQALKNLGQS
ncbi:Holliday junction branch migration protein RuvA [Patescibacteria group bacterium]